MMFEQQCLNKNGYMTMVGSSLCGSRPATSKEHSLWVCGAVVTREEGRAVGDELLLVGRGIARQKTEVLDGGCRRDMGADGDGGSGNSAVTQRKPAPALTVMLGTFRALLGPGLLHIASSNRSRSACKVPVTLSRRRLSARCTRVRPQACTRPCCCGVGCAGDRVTTRSERQQSGMQNNKRLK